MRPSTLRNEDANVLDNHNSHPPDLEREFVNHVLLAANPDGIHVDPLSITNLYVGLKSKPLTVLVGPADTGKIAAMQYLAKILIGDDPLRCQMMVGHPWWVSQSNDVVRFSEAQTCWNSAKIIDLIQEASLPENAQQMYVACLTRISPAELNEFFSEVAFQLRHDRVMRVASVHLSEPVPFPRNMFLVGTMDVNQFKWLDEDLLAKTSLIHWSPAPGIPVDLSTGKELLVNGEKTFLRACLRNVPMAFQKLYRILKSQRQAFFPLFETVRVLQKHKVTTPNSSIHSAMLYIANSWSSSGMGLFSQDNSTNLGIALDLAIVQIFLLPIQDKLVETAALRSNLLWILGDRFPHSGAFVGNRVKQVIPAAANRIQTVR